MTAWTPPTDEQLESFVNAVLTGEAHRRGLDIDAAFAARMVVRNPLLKEAWLERHRGLQEAVSAIREDAP